MKRPGMTAIKGHLSISDSTTAYNDEMAKIKC